MTYYKKDELYHFGILGQKLGVRRFQNDDGSLTAAGKVQYIRNENARKRSEAKMRMNKKMYSSSERKRLKTSYEEKARKNAKIADKSAKLSLAAIAPAVIGAGLSVVNPVLGLSVVGVSVFANSGARFVNTIANVKSISSADKAYMLSDKLDT